ncbi:gamma-glutamyltransferase [Nocardia sp. NBC_01499]|uniref:gamma-glutamyltransferase family protein n=1 Tax=Nocardia sp. NBC_01499 TaxID=2903597 RepID=UPI00386D2B17
MTDRPPLYGTFGVVSAPDSITSSVGMAILEKGGNAFDAAIAIGFTLQVGAPHHAGAGGEVVATFFTKSENAVRVLCGQGPAPAGATPEAMVRLGFESVPAIGLLGAAVPGAFDGWMLMLRDYGTKSLREVLEPAIGYASSGFPAAPRLAYLVDKFKHKLLNYWPTTAEVYLEQGNAPRPYSLVKNPALAETYSRIVREAEAASNDRDEQIEKAREVWRQGFVAAAITEFAATPKPDLTGTLHAGLLSADDLLAYRATYEAPTTFDWGDWTLCKPGPWSQGPVMLQQLALLADHKMDADNFDSADSIHMLSETAKLAYADRDAYYGDNGVVPIDVLLSKEYAKQRASLITRRASLDFIPGSIAGIEPALPRFVSSLFERGTGAADDVAAGSEPKLPNGDTCYIAVVDKFGNFVSASPSGGFLMRSPVIGALGFPLGNRLQTAWLDHGLPNTLTPGRRPRTTICPPLAMFQGEPFMAFGSPGGDRQDQWCLQFFLRVAGGISPQQAIEMPRWHTEHLVSSFDPHEIHLGKLEIESSVGESVIETLRSWGHDIEARPPKSLGRLAAAGRDIKSGLLFGAADPRGSVVQTCGR